MDIITYALALGDSKKYTDSKLNAGQFVGTVQPGGSFPTARPDGSALKSDDYVKPLSSAAFPFTIGSVTFANKFTNAIYLEGSWYADPGVLQDTSETPVKEPALESVGGTASTQAAVNKELVSKRCYTHEQSVAAATWSIAHSMGKYPAVTVIDSAGSVCEGDIAYPSKDSVTLTFSAAFSGKAYLS